MARTGMAEDRVGREPGGLQRSGGERESQVRGMAQELLPLRGALMPILHRVNGQLGYISADDERVIANVLNLSVADVHGVVSFYKDFRTTRPADCHVQVCRGEACQANGSQGLFEYAATTHGRRDSDPKAVEVEEIFCFGNCALGPTVAVNGELHGRMTPERLDKLVESSTRRPAEVPR